MGGGAFCLSCAAWGSDVICLWQRCCLLCAAACAFGRAGTHLLVSALQGLPTQPLRAVVPAPAWDISTFLQGMRGSIALLCCAPSGHALLPAVILQSRMPLSWGMAPICPSCFNSSQLLCMQWCRTVSPSFSTMWSAQSGLCCALTPPSCGAFDGTCWDVPAAV